MWFVYITSNLSDTSMDLGLALGLLMEGDAPPPGELRWVRAFVVTSCMPMADQRPVPWKEILRAKLKPVQPFGT